MEGRNHAVVIGASVAGLLAARVLSDYFERVTLIERDLKPDRPAARKGTPQALHVHGLLFRGMEILEGLFPGFTDDICKAGAELVDIFNRVKIYRGGWAAGVPHAHLDVLYMSRHLLEHHVDRRIRKLNNVRLRDGTVVRDLSLDDSRRRITGLIVESDGQPEELVADFVVDASGRGSRLPKWLNEHELPAPDETRVDLATIYATRTFLRPLGKREWEGLFVLPRPPEARGGVIIPIEGNRWLATVIGLADEKVPRQDDSFLEFARSLSTPAMFDALVEAQPLSPVDVYSFSGNQRRHYETNASLPDRLMVTGDAMCSFNPRFGQGMTVAAMEAVALASILQTSGSSLDGVATAFHRRAAEQIDVIWPAVIAEDLCYEQAMGDRSFAIRSMQWYTSRTLDRCRADPFVLEAFLRVNNFLASPLELFRPRMVARVLFGL